MQIELPIFPPIILSPRRYAFDDPKYLFELKYDGFRGIAQVAERECRILSRNLSTFKGFEMLRREIAASVHANSVVLDGEIVSLDDKGSTDFNALLHRKGNICYFAFDLLLLNGQDKRALPLMKRKELLRKVLPEKHPRLIFADFIETKGKSLFEMVKKNDLEGMVAKPRSSIYDEDKTKWWKIANPKYSGKEGRKEIWDKFYEK